MRKILILTASMLMLTVMTYADVIVEPPVAEQTAGAGMTVVFAVAAVVCVAIAILVWFIRKKK